MEIVINTCYGGFGISEKAIKRYLELKGKECYFYKHTKSEDKDGIDEYTRFDYYIRDLMSFHVSTKNLGEKVPSIPEECYFSPISINRTDEDLIKVVKELGSLSNDEFSKLKVIEIPDGISYNIIDNNGRELVDETHRCWY